MKTFSLVSDSFIGQSEYTKSLIAGNLRDVNRHFHQVNKLVGQMRLTNVEIFDSAQALNEIHNVLIGLLVQVIPAKIERPYKVKMSNISDISWLMKKYLKFYIIHLQLVDNWLSNAMAYYHNGATIFANELETQGDIPLSIDDVINFFQANTQTSKFMQRIIDFQRTGLHFVATNSSKKFKRAYDDLLDTQILLSIKTNFWLVQIRLLKSLISTHIN